jgi:2-oxoglutarate dehydrogenase complex dehydrogenase (E1) component-like enzyme
MRALLLVRSYEMRGHNIAKVAIAAFFFNRNVECLFLNWGPQVDPLELGKHNFNADVDSERNKWEKQLDISNYGFSEADLDKVMSFDIISKQRNQTGILADGAR